MLIDNNHIKIGTIKVNAHQSKSPRNQSLVTNTMGITKCFANEQHQAGTSLTS